MRVLIDTNIVLDVLLNREPFVRESRQIWQLADDGVIDAGISSFAVPTIHYICRRHSGIEAANRAVDVCLQAFEVCALYREAIIAARKMQGSDFEDNLQIACAETDFRHAIVTRNARDYEVAAIRVFTPAAFLAVMSK